MLCCCGRLGQLKIMHQMIHLIEMNAESSRSHLIIGITIETTNKTTGQVLTGKVRG